MSALRAPKSGGKVRPARLTDLAALGELSRLCQSDSVDTRSDGSRTRPVSKRLQLPSHHTGSSHSRASGA